MLSCVLPQLPPAQHLNNLYRLLWHVWTTPRGPQDPQTRPVRLLRALLHAVIKPRVTGSGPVAQGRRRLKKVFKNREAMMTVLQQETSSLRAAGRPCLAGDAVKSLLLAAGCEAPEAAVALLNDADRQKVSGLVVLCCGFFFFSFPRPSP